MVFILLTKLYLLNLLHTHIPLTRLNRVTKLWPRNFREVLSTFHLPCSPAQVRCDVSFILYLFESAIVEFEACIAELRWETVLLYIYLYIFKVTCSLHRDMWTQISGVWVDCSSLYIRRRVLLSI